MTFNDDLAQPVSLILPPDGASDIGTIINDKISNVSLAWQAIEGAIGYKWQLDYDTDFSSLPAGFEGNTTATSARLPSLEPATTYYWRVKATGPVLSPWSVTWSFTTSLRAEIIAPELISPEAGASGVEIKPAFQWSAVVGADRYELLVATDVSFANPVVVKVGDYALPTTTWQCDVTLDYDTTYYWKVRAIDSGTSEWSGVSDFTTELPPAQSEPSPPMEEPPAPEASPPPAPPAPSEPSTPDWVRWLMYLGGALLLTIVVTLITLIILTVRVSRR